MHKYDFITSMEAFEQTPAYIYRGTGLWQKFIRVVVPCRQRASIEEFGRRR